MSGRRSRAREGERRRRLVAEQRRVEIADTVTGHASGTSARSPADPSSSPPGRRVPGQALACGWCGQPIPMKSTGRLPKWCSPACRHRAWEQARAAASGRAAVQVVDRPVVVTPADVAGWTGQVEQLATELHGSAWPASGGELDALRVALGLAMSALEDRARFPGYDRWPGQLLSD